MVATWKTGIVVVVAILFAYSNFLSKFSFHFLSTNETNPTEDIIRNKLLEILLKSAKPNCTTVAVGYNSNLDLIVNAIEVLNHLIVKNSEEHKDIEKITSIEELGQVFTHYFEKGAAAERYVADKETWNKILEASKREENKKSWFVGGNAALMANRFAIEGCKNTILGGGPVGSMLQSLLDPSIQVVKNSNINNNNTDMDVDKDVDADEVHLILEYEKSTSWGSFKSPRANRFILHSDQSNSKLSGMNLFHSHLIQSSNSSNKPSVIVLSGFHLLDGQDPHERSDRLAQVVTIMKEEKIKDIPIHVELASIGDILYVSQLLSFILPNTDSLGLNEQELGSSYLAIIDSSDVHLHGDLSKYSREDFKEPKLSTVIHTINSMFLYAQDKISNHSTRRLSRIHFHCLAYHVIAQKTSSKWKNASQAVVAGSIAASSQACNLQDIELQFLHFFDVDGISFDPNNPVMTLIQNDITFFIAPVLVCKHPQKTVGLGDSISAVGLIQQVF